MAGLFIVFEGIECSGKSTQADMLARYCLSHDIPFVSVREPGSTPFGEKVRSLVLQENCSPEAEFLAFSASRAQLISEIITPSMAQQKVIICDRFFYSSLVYQGFARGLHMESLQLVSQFATGGLVPDFTFLINLNFDVAQKRLAVKKGRDRIENAGADFHKKVHDGYQELVHLYKNIIPIDGDHSANHIHNAILAQISQHDPRFYSSIIPST
ncbi:MAG: dTMP kinase [Brevinema sp.]